MKCRTLAIVALLSFSGCSLVFDSTEGSAVTTDAQPVGELDGGTSDANELDAGVAVLGPIVNVTNGAADSVNPTLLWDGENFRVFWESRALTGRDIMATVPGAGDTPALLATSTASNVGTTAIWTGSSMAAAWVQQDGATAELVVGLFDDNFAPISELETLSSSIAGIPFTPSIAATGTQLGVAWTNVAGADRSIYLSRLDGDGASIGEPSEAVVGGVDASVSFGGNAYGLSWQGESEDPNILQIFFRRFTATATATGETLPVSQSITGALFPEIVAIGLEQAIIWQQVSDSGGSVFFARVDANFSVSKPLLMSSADVEARAPDMVAGGDGFGMAWIERREGQLEVIFRQVDAAGAPIGSDIQLSEGVGSNGGVSIAYDGSGYGVSWYKGATGTRLVQFRSVRLP